GGRHGVAQALAVQAFDTGGDTGFRVVRRQRVAPRFGLGPAHAGIDVQDLALQVAEFDGVVVGQGDIAHAGGGQVQRGGRPQAARADDQDLAGQEFFLALDTQLVEQDMPRIAQQLLVVHLALAGSTPDGVMVRRSGSPLPAAADALACARRLPFCTGLPASRFRACCSWKSSLPPNSNILAAGGGVSRSSVDLISSLWLLDRWRCRSASRGRRNRSPSAVSATT